MEAIRLMIPCAVEPRRVFALVATGGGLRQWWAADVTETPTGVTIGFYNRATVYRLRAETMMIPARVVWTVENGDEWANTQLHFDVESDGTESRLYLTHGGWRAQTDFFLQCTATWGTLLWRLKRVAEGSEPGPFFTQDGTAID